VPKDKERRKKKKQDISKMVIETIPTKESPEQASARKKKCGHKDSNKLGPIPALVIMSPR